MPFSHGQTTLLLLAAVAPPSPEPLRARAWAEAAAEAAAAGDQGREGNADSDQDEPPREEARAIAVTARTDGRALVVVLQGRAAIQMDLIIQGSAKVSFTGLMKFVVAAAAYHGLALPAAFTQPGTHLLANTCTCICFDVCLKLSLRKLPI